jgi:hypothetical protein
MSGAAQAPRWYIGFEPKSMMATTIRPWHWVGLREVEVYQLAKCSHADKDTEFWLKSH